ncbi:ankyrin repeat and SAM domain-containing protein 6-like [Wyeomyia smithii]|uniref:ankyrin repeat and SAM domain-containing protein 6-like n=1 Tax=Wyeomyia smithii TaxID=174621 RepID=UPI002467C91F|nr:ankyrin repeat and SAM domain-containing protein 6-like [Wyeomyia smithii]
MFRTRQLNTVQPSPSIVRFSPEALDSRDVSFEAYKQAKHSKTRKRSFSPLVNAKNMRSPDISPIALNKPMRVSPRTNTPKTVSSSSTKVPSYAGYKMTVPKKDGTREQSRYGLLFAIATPITKRELEHRITVDNILKNLDLVKYMDIFIREEIDFEVFLTLSEKDLHDIGIDCQADIERILAKVAEYNAGT